MHLLTSRVKSQVEPNAAQWFSRHLPDKILPGMHVGGVHGARIQGHFQLFFNGSNQRCTMRWLLLLFHFVSFDSIVLCLGHVRSFCDSAIDSILEILVAWESDAPCLSDSNSPAKLIWLFAVLCWLGVSATPGMVIPIFSPNIALFTHHHLVSRPYVVLAWKYFGRKKIKELEKCFRRDQSHRSRVVFYRHDWFETHFKKPWIGENTLTRISRGRKMEPDPSILSNPWPSSACFTWSHIKQRK